MPNFAIPSLMPITSPREDGFCAPLMRSNFDLMGLMELESVRSDTQSTFECVSVITYNSLSLSYYDSASGANFILSYGS